MLPAGLDLHVLDLDGSLPPQGTLRDGDAVRVHDLRAWGPRIRMACGLRTFRTFTDAVAAELGPARPPKLVLYGSGDFHNVTLALLRTLSTPFNLLVLDKHPDWVRGLPFLHCGTWLARALRLPNLGRVYHVGGDLDFDNHYAPFAPWRELRSGRIRMFPARRRFTGFGWGRVPHQPLLVAGEPLEARLERLVESDRPDLAARPLYVTIDKDVLTESEAAVNWDSGYLSLPDLLAVLDVFGRAAGGRFAGVDLLGDWSPVRMAGWPRQLLDRTEHPPLTISPADAAGLNRRANRTIIARLDALVKPHAPSAGSSAGPAGRTAA